MDGELRKLFRRHLPRVAWSSIETGAVEPGVADMNGCRDGVEVWVEMKKTDGWTVDVKISQVAWHKLRQSRGGRTFFAVRRGDSLRIFHGRDAESLRAAGLKGTAALLTTDGGPSSWDWAEIEKTLFGGVS
jgi:hypothetical protein